MGNNSPISPIIKAKVKSVMLNRAEGPISKCGSVTIPASGVLSQLRLWGETAPEPGGGYDKVDFTVTWEDGNEYSGRFDLQRGGTDGHEDFWTSLQHCLEYYACTRRPSHFKDNHWQHHCEAMEKDGGKATCVAILNNCMIGLA